MPVLNQFCTSFTPSFSQLCTIFAPFLQVLRRLTKNISGSCSTSTFLWCWCPTTSELSPRSRSTTMPSTRKTCQVISRLENVSIYSKTENVYFFQVKEYCPLVFRNLRERLFISKISINFKEFVSMASKYPFTQLSFHKRACKPLLRWTTFTFHFSVLMLEKAFDNVLIDKWKMKVVLA